MNDGLQIQFSRKVSLIEGVEIGPIITQMVRAPLQRIDVAVERNVNDIARHEVNTVILADFCVNNNTSR